MEFYNASCKAVVVVWSFSASSEKLTPTTVFSSCQEIFVCFALSRCADDE